MPRKLPKIIVIAGPTASGKTSLAIELAESFSGEIINADSMQVYRYMDVGTAKASAEERSRIPHHLLDVADPDEEFNAALYSQLAQKAIEAIQERNRIGFVVGGTGLYIKTLLGGLLKSPPSSPEIRRSLVRKWEEGKAAALYDLLKTKDAEAATHIHPHDRTRIIRALEVMALTEKRFTDLIREHGFGEKKYQPLKLVIDSTRETLYQMINDRSVDMIKKGLVNETEYLLNRGYSADLKPMKSLGYRHAIHYLNGEWSHEQMTHFLQRDTRHYAKRQLTWFRADSETVWIKFNERSFLKEMISRFLSEQ